MALTITCCYGCVAPKRHTGCHGTCEEYLAQREHLTGQKAQIQMSKISEGDVSAYIRDHMRKEKK